MGRLLQRGGGGGGGGCRLQNYLAAKPFLMCADADGNLSQTEMFLLILKVFGNSNLTTTTNNNNDNINGTYNKCNINENI